MSIPEPTNFILNKIREDIKTYTKDQHVQTRFPPEPNGHLHIGHAKSLCINFGTASLFPGGTCNLRFDDTNPNKEEQEYSDSIIEDIEWMGFKWNGQIRHASDYFEKLYQCAVELIKRDKAYICDLSAEDIRKFRGTLREPGKNCCFRKRSIEENLELFSQMRAGKFPEGTRVLRAKIDMSSGNINMRDPVLYRILFAKHPRLGDAWKIYPTYDFTHCLCDSFEGITHSLCTLEFQDHRPLYDWVIESLPGKHHPQQLEFARLNISHTVTSKRKLKELVDKKIVSAWDDPRIFTLKGLRRRGYTPESIKDFCNRLGVSKKDTIIDVSILEECLRNDLNIKAQRRFAITDPIKVVIENYPQDKSEWLTVKNNPKDPEAGERKIAFSKELWIDRSDVLEDAPKGYHRLSLNKEVRLRYSYIIMCKEIIKDPKTGKIESIVCTYDPQTLGKKPEGRKVKGIIHWLEKSHAKKAKFNLYDRLFNEKNPDAGEKGFISHINPNSLQTKEGLIEESLEQADSTQHFQFERVGYFIKDSKEKNTFNLTTTLKETWQK